MVGIKLVFSFLIQKLDLLNALVVVVLLRQYLPQLIAVAVEVCALLCKLLLD